MRRALLAAAAATVLAGSLLDAVPSVVHSAPPTPGPIVAARASEPVVITGSQIPSWSRSSATGVPAAYPSGASKSTGGDGVRSAHNGIVTVPPDTRTGVDPDQITAFRWDPAKGWREVPVQVDQRYPYFLANGHSSFSIYSGTDEELTYAWNPTAHSIGEEAWKKVFGGILGLPSSFPDPNPCRARYQLPGAPGTVELAQAIHDGVVS